MNNSSVGSPRTSPAPLRGAAAVVGGSGGSGSGKCFGPDGCPAVANGRRCGETRNLQIIQEFKRLYETKMKQIDDAAGGDCVQAKINLQQEWIRDLTDQNEMLVRVVEELEVEAAERVTMLEEKLQQSAKCACEKMGYIQNDLNNLIEVLRRVKQYGVWNAKDLRFYTINIEDLTSDSALARRNLNGSDEEECRCQCNCKREGDANNRNCKHEKLAKEKDKKVNELQEKIARLRGTIEENEDAKKTYIQYQELKKSMLDMRDALTAEVAEKHDAVLSLRREVHMLEEQCRKADQQVHFKDDIIKELRKEIKQLKLQRCKKSRSPRTLKRSETRHVHSSSRTEPDTNIKLIKDGTIVIKDSATIGDTVATQAIREKYSDPTNQTVVYICESVPQRHRSKSRLGETTQPEATSIAQAGTNNNNNSKGDCEVSLDVSRGCYSSRDNSRDIELDFPRNAAGEDVSRDSGDFIQRNFLAYPSIHETCIRYSKDILEMLNTHNSSEDKKEDLDVEKMANENSGESELKEFESKRVIDNDSETFLSNTLTRCERFFLDMYRDKCKSVKMEEGRDNQNNLYLKKIHDYYNHTCRGENCADNLEKYDIHSQQLGERDISYKSNGSQTVGSYQLDKDTQTSQLDLCVCDTTCDLSVTSSYVRRRSENDIGTNTDEYLRDKIEEAPSLKHNDVDEHVATEIWNNPAVGSEEISFEEAEISAFSTPFYEEPPNYYPHPQMLLSRHAVAMDDIPSCEQKIYRRCIPIRHYVLPHPPAPSMSPYFRQPKVLSPRTLRKLPPPHMRHVEVPLSFKSRSLPICGEVYASRHDLQKPVKLHKVRRHPVAHADFADVAFVVGDRNVRKNEVRGFVDSGGRERVNSGCKEGSQCFEHWSMKMNNTF